MQDLQRLQEIQLNIKKSLIGLKLLLKVLRQGLEKYKQKQRKWLKGRQIVSWLNKMIQKMKLENKKCQMKSKRK